MDEFAQSREDDDLFGDEIIPIAPSQPAKSAVATSGAGQKRDESKAQPSDAQHTTTERQHIPRERGRGRGRGRGGPNRGRGQQRSDNNNNFVPKSTAGGLSESRFSPKAVSGHANSTSKEEESTPQFIAEQPQEGNVASEDNTPPPNAPTGPSNLRPAAVRGDRTHTGGQRPKKLSEAELSAKLAAAKEKAQSVAAAHAKAQADAAEFEERERVAQEKRREEDARRKAMESERAANRTRKMKAQGGREWDEGKDEADFKPQRYGERVRRGDQKADDVDLRIYEWRDEDEIRAQTESVQGRGRGRGRGRGDFRGGRGGPGRGDFAAPSVQKKPDVKAAEDFPALPGNTSTGGPKAQPLNNKPTPIRIDSDTAPAGGSWADQVSAAQS